MPKPRQTVLVVVHPGSACGSADFNLGRTDADLVRSALIMEVGDWEGPVVVIDGALSDDLDQGRFSHREWGAALFGALSQAAQDGHVSRRIRGDDAEDFDQRSAIVQLVQEHGWTPKDHDFVVTGAWYHPQDRSGCVGSVVRVLRNRGFRASVGAAAARLELESTDPVVSLPSRRPRAR